MKINVRVSPRSKSANVLKEGGVYHVRVVSPPVEGKANQEVITLLAEYFGTAKLNVKIVRGANTRAKLVEILGH